MSVRRLADEAVQPAEFGFDSARSAEARKWIAKYPQGREQSAVIPLLMLAQEQEGWVSRAAIEHVAAMLDMPLIRVLEVATFYTQFQLHPVGTRAHIQVCGTTPCMLRGAGDLIDLCKSRIHAEPGQTNADGTLSWEEVECVGACVNAPVVMIFKDSYEDLTVERLAEIIDQFEAGNGASVPTGPQIERRMSAPAGRPTSLIDADDARTHGLAEREPASASTPEAKPEAIAKPRVNVRRPAEIVRPETPDRLTLISGIGPRNEGKLHDLGVFTFAQIAAWTEDEIAWVDDALNFKGRIQREKWIEQADALATGGETEYLRRFGKTPR